MPSDAITTLLNKVSAIIACKASSFKELSKDTGIGLTHLYDIVNARRHDPNGDKALALHEWAAKRTLNIARRPHLAERYRQAYAETCEKFPLKGEGK